MPLVDKDTPRLHSEMYGMHRLMRTPHGNRSRVDEGWPAVDKDQRRLRRSFSRAHSDKARADEKMPCMHRTMSEAHGTMTVKRA